MSLKEQKQRQVRKQLDALILHLEASAKKNYRLDQVELELFKRLLNLGLHLLQYYILLVSEMVLLRGAPLDQDGQKMRHAGKAYRRYRSIYGELQIERIKYYSLSSKQVYYTLDEELSLPQGRYSYVLQDWLGYAACELDYDQSAKFLERILFQNFEAMQSSRVAHHLCERVEQFYQSQDGAKLAAKDGPYLCLGADGKGVPIIRTDRDGPALSTVARLGKGKPKGIKKEATVCVSSSFVPRSRDAEQLLAALFRSKINTQDEAQTGDHQFHLQKHVRAFVANKPRSIEYGIEHLVKRDPSGKKPIITLMDGAPALKNQILKAIKQKGLDDRLDACILDFIHVLEKLWQVANAYKGEDAPDRQEWVEQQARKLLHSQTQQVIIECRRIQQLKSYTKHRAKNIKDCIRYFEKRIDMMDYKTFLAKGYPITTGAVESACGHFVKGRMERNGMRWTLSGAQKILDLRAVCTNDDWQSFIQFSIEQEQQQLYKIAA